MQKSFKITEGCFQLTFANGVTLSISSRYAFGYADANEGCEYVEVRAWDAEEREIDLAAEYTGRIDQADFLQLAEKLQHPLLLKCQDCETDISPRDDVCKTCGEGLSHPWLLLI